MWIHSPYMLVRTVLGGGELWKTTHGAASRGQL